MSLVALPVYFEDEHILVREPKCPLAPGALEIVIKGEEEPLEESYRRIFGVYQRVKNYWSEASAAGCVLAKGSYYLERRDVSTRTVLRQLIPFAHGGFYKVLQQMQVTWNLLCPTLAWIKNQPLGKAEGLQAALRKEITPTAAQQPLPRVLDPFCRMDRINAQQVLERAHTRLLWNFKPVSTNDLLIISKEHKETFDERGFVEGMTLGAKVNAEYAKKGFPVGYLTSADHVFAGQTVPHAHIHVSSASSLSEEVWGIAIIVRKILFDSWAELLCPTFFRLSDKQLEGKITACKAVLKDV